MTMDYENGSMAVSGRNTEAIIKDWLSKNTQVKELIDVSDKRSYQRLDVDIILTLHDGRQIQVEIKTDSNLLLTNNFLFELQRIYCGAKSRHPSSLGWSVKTPAEYIVWFSPKKEKIVSMKTNDYRRAFMDYMIVCKNNPRFNVQCTSEDYCTTVNILFPVDYLKNYKIHDLGEEMDFVTPKELNVPF